MTNTNETNFTNSKNILNKNMPETEEELKNFSKEELYACANKLLEKPYETNEILLILLKCLFNDETEFVSLFCKFLEKAYPYYLGKSKIEIIANRITEKKDVSFDIVKSMVDMGNEKGVSAGTLLFMIYDQMEEADNFLIKGLESKNGNFQRCSLVSLLCIMHKGSSDILSKYLDIFKKCRAKYFK